MDFEEYQKKAKETAVYKSFGAGFVYPSLGLAGEAGEVAEKVKKLIRDKDGVIDDEFRRAVAKELGDVLWYVATLCTEFDLSLAEVAAGNSEKLLTRKEQGKLHGSSDNR